MYSARPAHQLYPWSEVFNLMKFGLHSEEEESIGDEEVKRLKVPIALHLHLQLRLTATEHHLPYEITPDRHR